LNGTRALAPDCFNCKIHQVAIVEHKHDSHDSWSFLHKFLKTVGEEDDWSTNQKEFLYFGGELIEFRSKEAW
jgi:hypothetical protein